MNGLIDLAAAELGGRVVETSDEFFAEAANLLQPGRAQFLPGKFTDRGKWMDGWESRRKRAAGNDWCVLALGAPGEVVGFDVDTQHFVGNHPPFASVDGRWLGEGADPAGWVSLLEQTPLRPDAQNLFAATARGPVTHVRLNIFPDGGVARFRVFGRALPRWEAPPDLDAEARAHVAPELRDLAAVKNGGLALACSDAFFGPMNNLLLPGRPADMGGGWETRRRRGAGHDWILVRLGGRGAPAIVELDTCHFKGNFPDRASVDAIDAPAGARITDLLAADALTELGSAQRSRRGRFKEPSQGSCLIDTWRPLLPESKLRADARHFFPVAGGAATHVRLNIFPDGGVARLRVWGRRDG
jgi:allantoicase